MGAPAPIRSHPDVAAFAEGAAEWIEGSGGHQQRAALFPVADAIGTVVLSTGRTEFIEKYFEVIGELIERRFTVLIHDWRGQGLSSRLLPDILKGHANRFDDLVADYGVLLNHYEARLPKPWIELSHSMGGCLVLTALARGERRFTASMQTAPMLGIKPQANPILRGIVWLMDHLGFSNRYALGSEPDPFKATYESDRLTHDRSRYERTHALIVKHPELALGGVTWGWVESAFEAISWLNRAPEVARVDLPIVMLSSGQENLVDNEGQKRIAARLPNCRLVEIPEAFHEIMMETDDIRAIFWREFDALVAKVISPSA